MATFKAVIFKGENHIKSDGSTNIKIRITHNRRADYISTKWYVVPNKSKKGYSLGTNAAFLEQLISNKINLYQKECLKLNELADSMTVQELKRYILTGEKIEIDFIKFADEYLLNLKTAEKQGSTRAVRGFLANLKKFSPNLSFSQIDNTFLISFEKWMKAEGVKNGIASYMARFRVVFNKGRERYNDEDRGIIKIANYPFKKYKIVQPLGSAKNSCLTVEQMNLFINHKPSLNRSKLAKDMFLLQFCLIGINTKDLFFAANPVKGRLVFDRFKTDRAYSIKIEPEAKPIIEKYKSKTKLLSLDYSDYLNFQKAINKGLKVICDSIQKEIEKNRIEIDFPKKITSNWARHTWATIARNDCKINKDDVALCLGHEDQDNRVTDLYIKYDYSIIDEANRKVLDLVFGNN